MNEFWAIAELVGTVAATNLFYVWLRKLEAHLRGKRRAKQGLCGEYAVSNWDRRIDWCGRQTPDHKVHCFGSDPLQLHAQDAHLREQGL